MTVTLVASAATYDPKWSDRALCSYDEWPDLWHPDGTAGVQVLAQTAEARRICGICPVRQACLDDAMRSEGSKKPDGRYGIRGALDPDERYKLHRRRAAKQAAA